MLAQHLGVPGAQVVEEAGGPSISLKNRRFGHGHRGPILRLGTRVASRMASQHARGVDDVRAVAPVVRTRRIRPGGECRGREFDGHRETAGRAARSPWTDEIRAALAAVGLQAPPD